MTYTHKYEQSLISLSLMLLCTLSCALGQGVKNDSSQRGRTNGGRNQLEQVIMRTATSYGTDGVYVENLVYVLYKDGQVSRDIEDDPVTVDIESSKRKRSKNWGRWSKRGNSINIAWNSGKSTDIDKWFVVRARRKSYPA